jgi:amino acid permease
MVSFSVAVLALINSMVGSAIIILPVMAINNGLLTTFAIIILTAIAACYSNYVTLEHISENELGYKEAVHRHSKK